MKTFDIISHCYAVKYPHYAQALCYQLTSIWDAYKAGVRIQIIICCDAGDLGTLRVLSLFGNRGVPVKGCVLTTAEMSRRSIGRNIATRTVSADVVWFADCDQVWDVSIWDKLARYDWPDDVSMVYPSRIKIHRDHQTGDLATGKVVSPRMVRIDETEFIDKSYDRAIGGVQIVKGDFAHEHGYLRDDEKWQKPNSVVLGDFRDDLAYRRFCQQHGSIIGIDLPGMYRIRHTTTSYQ